MGGLGSIGGGSGVIVGDPSSSSSPFNLQNTVGTASSINENNFRFKPEVVTTSNRIQESCI